MFIIKQKMGGKKMKMKNFWVFMECGGCRQLLRKDKAKKAR